jgi:hypothetical protein
MLVPSVFCSHIMPSKTQALCSASWFKAVFVNILKPRYVATGRWLCVPLELFHQDMGGRTNYQCLLRVFTPMVLSLEGVSVKKPTPRGVCSITHDHHFGVELQGQASRQHRTPPVWGTGKGIFHGDGLYPMSVTYNPLFVLRSCHSASKWCNRCLKRNEQLQMYDSSDNVLKQLNEETNIALLNVQVLRPLKMLYRGILALFSILPGGVEVLIDRKVQMLKVNVPVVILSSRVSHTEQSDLFLGRYAEVVGIKNEATKHDDAEVPIHLWNDLLTRLWRSLEGSDDSIDEELNVKLHKAADTIRNKLVLPFWKKNVMRLFMVWFKTTYRTQVNMNPPRLWGKYWSQFNSTSDGIIAVQQYKKGVICDVGNLKIDCQEVARNEIQLRR